jgi:hypothetical protein
MRRCTGFEAVADERQGAVQHHVHRVVEVGAFGVFAQRNALESLEGGGQGVGHRGVDLVQGINRF